MACRPALASSARCACLLPFSSLSLSSRFVSLSATPVVTSLYSLARSCLAARLLTGLPPSPRLARLGRDTAARRHWRSGSVDRRSKSLVVRGVEGAGAREGGEGKNDSMSSWSCSGRATVREATCWRVREGSGPAEGFL